MTLQFMATKWWNCRIANCPLDEHHVVITTQKESMRILTRAERVMFQLKPRFDNRPCSGERAMRSCNKRPKAGKAQNFATAKCSWCSWIKLCTHVSSCFPSKFIDLEITGSAAPCSTLGSIIKMVFRHAWNPCLHCCYCVSHWIIGTVWTMTMCPFRLEPQAAWAAWVVHATKPNGYFGIVPLLPFHFSTSN